MIENNRESADQTSPRSLDLDVHITDHAKEQTAQKGCTVQNKIIYIYRLQVHLKKVIS